MTTENTAIKQENPTAPEDGAGTENQAMEGSRTFSQEEVDRLVGKARIKERSKYEGFDAFKAKADQYDAFKAEKEQEIEELKAQLAEVRESEAAMSAQMARASAVSKVSAETGIPASAIENLRGDTYEELSEMAASLRSSIPMYPTTGDTGKQGGGANDPSAEFAKFMKEHF